MAYRFKNTITVESEVCPGVEFLLRKITDGRRSEFRLTLAKKQAKLETLGKMIKNPPEGKTDFECGVDVDEFVMHEIEPAKITWATVKVTGLELEDENGNEFPGTLDNILDWPMELRQELLSLIDDRTVLLESEAKNFGPRTTFGAVVARKMNDTSVINAGAPATPSIETETAPGITPQ